MDENLFQQCIRAVNQRISQSGFQITLAKPRDIDAIQNFVSKNTKHGCMEIDLSRHAVIYAYDTTNGAIAAHIAITPDETSDGEKFISISMSCTDINYRRRRLTTFLRIAVFVYAIEDPQISYIASDVNKSSKAVLEKFGFVGEVGNYLEKFNWEHSAFVDAKDRGFIAQVEKFFI